MITVYVKKNQNPHYKYLASWVSPEGHPFFQGFDTKKEINEYFRNWLCNIVYVEKR